jgi:hypothetical protein
VNFTTLAVLVFGGILLAMWSSKNFRFWQVFVAILFGFYLADSGLAPSIGKAVEGAFDWVATWKI